MNQEGRITKRMWIVIIMLTILMSSCSKDDVQDEEECFCVEEKWSGTPLKLQNTRASEITDCNFDEVLLSGLWIVKCN